MLVVELNLEKFEYDVHSLVKAFYPVELVKVVTPETKGKNKEALDADRKIIITLEEGGGNILIDGNAYEWQYARQSAEQYAKQYTEQYTGQCTEQYAGQYDGNDRIEAEKKYKERFKRFLYLTLMRHTGRELPWGNLTGIRPTKIAYKLLEEGSTRDEVITFMRKEHFVSEEKALLSVDIAGRERRLLEDVHWDNGYSLYIGIPFCPTTCLYCSFTSFPIGVYKDVVEQYIDCLIREMDYVAERFSGKILDSVYVGGGTPTTLTADQLERLITAVKDRFDLSGVKEFTVEAGRPDSITEDKLKVLYQQGIGRISINPQTMNQKTLQTIGRQHTVEQFLSAYHLARETGFDDINMDIILGLPGEEEPEVRRTMDEITMLKPDSLTVHSLAVKRASRLSSWVMENGLSALNNTDKTMEIAARGAQKLGMLPYYLYRQKNMSGNFENVGYARPGKEGLYNILIMEEKQTIAALGAGSITKLVLPDGRIERRDNVKDVRLYMERIEDMISRKEELFG